MTNTIFKNIDYKTLKNNAYDFLNIYSNGRLPIDLIHIINQLDNLHLMKYTTFAKIRHLKLENVYELLQSDDGALWYQTNTDTYILLYNDTIKSKERIRFTIAHELGHYVLKHNELTNKTILSRYNLADKEYDRFEMEANFFAKHLLVPFPILENYCYFFEEMNVPFIMKEFLVSRDVATFIIGDLKRKQKLNIPRDRHYLEENFTTYIVSSQSTKICKSCHSKIDIYSHYCHVCSIKQYKHLTTLDAYLENKNREKERMKYFKYDFGESGIPPKCPQCENEELNSGKYYNICGVYIQNICIGNYEDNFDSWGNQLSITDFLNDGCKKILAGNSRYCPDCGGKSSYFFQGLLKTWQLEKQEQDTKIL